MKKTTLALALTTLLSVNMANATPVAQLFRKVAAQLFIISSAYFAHPVAEELLNNESTETDPVIRTYKGVRDGVKKGTDTGNKILKALTPASNNWPQNLKDLKQQAKTKWSEVTKSENKK